MNIVQDISWEENLFVKQNVYIVPHELALDDFLE